MVSLALAGSSFALLHLLVSGTTLRDALVGRLGAGPYRALFSLASAATLGWLIYAYGHVRVVNVTPLAGLRPLAHTLVLLAFLLMVLGLATPAPTAVGQEKLMDREARGIHRITRHPFLWGISLWAAVHALFNPDAASLIFFGTFVVVGVAGTFSIDGKRARMFGAAWSKYAANTSNLPFAAIAAGRNTLSWTEIGVAKPLIALAAFGAFAMFHAKLFGISPF